MPGRLAAVEASGLKLAEKWRNGRAKFGRSKGLGSLEEKEEQEEDGNVGAAAAAAEELEEE